MQWQLTVARHPLYRLTIRSIEEKGRRAERLVLAHYKVNEEFDVVREHVGEVVVLSARQDSFEAFKVRDFWVVDGHEAYWELKPDQRLRVGSVTV